MELEQKDDKIVEIIETVTRLVSEASIEVGGQAPRRPVGRISEATKDLIKKRQSMKMSNGRDQIELAELSKLINKRKSGIL